MKSILSFGLSFLLILSVSNIMGQNNGDYRSAQNGDWTTISTWEVYNGTTWVAASSYPDLSTIDVTIQNGDTITYSTLNRSMKTLTVESGAQLKRGNSSTRAILVYGDVVCNGNIGRGPADNDRIELEVWNDTCTISGSGVCIFSFIDRPLASTNDTTVLYINMDVYLNRTSGSNLSNLGGSSSHFEVTIAAGKTVNAYSLIDLEDSELLIQSNTSGVHGSLKARRVDNSDENNTTIERWLTEDEWHYICSPTDDPSTALFLFTYFITWNEADSNWRYIYKPDSVLATDMMGFGIQSTTALQGDTMIEFKGALNWGDKSIDIVNSMNGTHESEGINFVGNPYAASINFNSDSWDLSDIDSTIYLWNPTAGNYGAYVRDDVSGTNSVDSIIPPHQGFMVYCKNATGTLVVEWEAQTMTYKTFFKNPTVVPHGLSLMVEEPGSYSDEIMIKTHPGATLDYDSRFDAYKILGIEEAPQLYMMGSERKLSINAIPEIESDLVIPLGFKGPDGTMFTFNANSIDLPEDVGVFLMDNYNSNTTNLIEDPSYTFLHQAWVGDFRFELLFTKMTSIASTPADEMAITAYGSDDKIIINSELDYAAEVHIRNLLGQEVLSSQITPGYNSISMPSEGFYIVTISGQTGIISKKVIVK